MAITSLFTNPLLFIVWIAAVLFALTVHEFAHALAATWLGDSTPEAEGRLTLNPLAHVDALGLILLVTVGFGWGKPVHFDNRQLCWPRYGSAIVGLAGPLANLISLILIILVIRWWSVDSVEGNLMTEFFLLLAIVNANLMIFNLLPIPPLDGSHLLIAALPDQYYQFKITLLTQGPLILFALVIIDSFTGGFVFHGLFNWVYNLIFTWLL